MKLRLHNRDIEELMLERSFPTNFQLDPSTGILENIYDGRLLGFNGFYREIFMENIHIGYGDMTVFQDTELGFDSEMETVELHFALFGKTHTEDFESKQSYLFGYNHHNIIYTHGFRGRSLFSANKNIKLFEINLTTHFFKQFLPRDVKYFQPFLQAIEQKKTSSISNHNFIITTPMQLIIREILGCQRKGVFKRMFLQAKVIELLLLQLEQMLSSHNETFYSIKPRDVERMYAVREHILTHLNGSYTLTNLAQQFGTNEFTLKKGFKEVFGTTVFNFWSEAKMEEAKKMLLEGELNISQVSDKIGYKNPQHFSTAFKRKFGYVPSQLKKKIKS